uniref:Uncharacterized protein n=1 Tax=Rhizophora mucronata TaxID=61149 RepID=A0A2P2QTJ5_RHIMU
MVLNLMQSTPCVPGEEYCKKVEGRRPFCVFSDR